MPSLFYIFVPLIVFLLVFPPLLVLFLASLRPSDAMPFDSGPLTLQNYVELVSDPFILELLLNTLVYTGCSLVVGLMIALPIVWLVERTDIPFKQVISTLMFVPLIIPGMLTAFGWVLLLSPRTGFINNGLRYLMGVQGIGPLNIYTFWGLIFLTGISIVPGMFIMLSGLFRNMDPELEEAGIASGGNVRNVLFRVTLPLMLPGTVSVGIYYTIILMEFFEIPLTIGLNADFPVLSVFIYSLVHPENETPSYGMAGAFGVIAVCFGIVLANFYRRLTQGAYKFAVIRGRRSSRRIVQLGRWKYVGFAAIVIYLSVKVVLPFLALLWSSLFSSWTPMAFEALNSITLEVYRAVFLDERLIEASINSLILLLGAGTGTMLLATLISWIVVRSQKTIAKWLDAVSFIPRAIPGVVTSLGVLLIFIWTPFYGTIWLLVIGHLINFLPFGVRIMNASLLQIHGELEEASKVSGAGLLATLKWIVIPLLRPSLWNGWLWVVAHSVRDFTFPLMLGTASNLVIAQLLWDYWQVGLFERASALAVILIGFLMLLVLPARYYIERHQTF